MGAIAIATVVAQRWSVLGAEVEEKPCSVYIYMHTFTFPIIIFYLKKASPWFNIRVSCGIHRYIYIYCSILSIIMQHAGGGGVPTYIYMVIDQKFFTNLHFYCQSDTLSTAGLHLPQYF